ncbi:MAG: protease [Pedosphaera sp.]|nr:protease [Pedosphaera sp.]
MIFFMSDELRGKRIAILVENGFEQVEMTEPRKALDEAGAETDLISPVDKKVKSWDFTKWGRSFKVDVPLSEAQGYEYDALLLPGGVINPDKLRINPQAVEFVRSFFDAGKPVASICHGPWTIIETGAARGRRMTSWPSLRTDLRNAGAEWVDEEVVVDNRLVTSRKPDDIPAFNTKMIEEFREGPHRKPPGETEDKRAEFASHAGG